MKVCIDSQVFIWGIKKQATDSQQDMIIKSEQFFKWADENDYDILIPTIVIAEVLAPEPIELHSQYFEIINKYFEVVNVDNIVASKYAQILHNRFNEVKELAKQENIRREKMKFDHLIIACALIQHASCIYSYDAGLKKFANGLIDVRELPIITVQAELPL